MENKLLSQFIAKLSLACRAQDRELDSKLTQLRNKLEQVDSPFQAMAEISQVHNHLQDNNVLQDSLKETRTRVLDATVKLQKLKGIPSDLRRELRVFLEGSQPYTIQEHQSRISTVLSFYQQMLNAKEKESPDFLRSHQEHNQPAEFIDAKLHKRICDELQRLITELDFAGEFGEQLANIRKQLLSGMQPVDLPELCLKLINLIIDGTREERKASQAFLYSLNESLTSFHHNFSASISESKELRKDRVEFNDDLKSRLDKLGLQVDTTNDLLQLKLSIQSQLGEIGKLLLQKEQLEAREQDLEQRLSQMENKLRLMKEETAEYKKRLSAQKHKLFLDSLTQVYNRAALDERLELEYKRWQRYDNPLCLAIVDIDHFKSINDNFGHIAGDKALKVIAKALQKCLRDTDFIARFGGEEFVLLLPNVDGESLRKPLEKLRETIKGIPFKFKDKRVTISVSIGATVFKDGDQPLDAFERADQSLYEAKSQGRDCVILNL